MKRMPTLAVPAIIVLAVVIVVTVIAERDTGHPTYENWAKSEAQSIERYVAFLKAHGVDAVLPLSQLLISARDVSSCPSLRYLVPPQVMWEKILPTLRLIKALKEARIIQPRAATSGYRSPAANDCSRGAKGSMHLTNNAIDMDIEGTPERTRALCDFWLNHGAQYRFGLGFYSDTAIHLDTGGHRTWGSDFTARTSLCTHLEKKK